MITCCLNCTSRHKACHDTCEKYKAEKKDFEERKAFVYELNHSQSGTTVIMMTSTENVARNGFSEVNLEVKDKWELLLQDNLMVCCAGFLRWSIALPITT